MIEFKCSECGKQLRVKDDAAGKKGKCPQCGVTLEVPTPQEDALIAEHEASLDPSPPQPAVRSDSARHAATMQPPPLERGHVNQAPSVNVHMPKRTSSLGVVSLILGVVAFLLCWIPFIGVLSIPLSSLGVLLAGIGLLVALFRRGSGIGWPIGGGVVSGLALIIGIAQVAAIGGVAEGLRQSAEEANRTHQEVVTPGPSGNASQAESDRTSGNEQIAGQERSVTPQWASAADPVRQGDIELRVTQVLEGKVPLRTGFDDRETASQDDLLAINIEMKNLSRSSKIEYSSWQGRDMAFSRDYATLQDNFGNGYKRISFGFGMDIVGQTQSDSIYPGKSLADVLVFELPVDTAEYLNLELPAKNFGGEGMLRLRIPANMIQRR
jgi:hypothetical protein